MARPPLQAAAFILTALACLTPAFAGEERVPDVVGLNVEKAQALMAEAGFEVSVQRVVGKPLGIVFSQDPSGLCTRDTSTRVTLEVGGPTPKVGTDMPPVDRPGAGDAGRGNAGRTPPDDLPPAGNLPVEGPSGDGLGAPPAGAGEAGTVPSAPRDPGTTTKPPTNWPTPTEGRTEGRSGGGFSYQGRPVPEEPLANTNGPALPGVLGQQAASARRALSSYRVRVEQTAAMPELVGQVLNQWPFAGSPLAAGEEVTIVVGVARLPGPNFRGVPQIQDQPWQEAVQRAERAGFQVRLTALSSPDSKRGRIVMQTPLPGSLLELGGTMLLRIGAGTGPYVPGAAGPERAPVATEEPPVRPDPVRPLPAPSGTTPAPLDAPPAGGADSPIDTPPADEERTPDVPAADEPTEEEGPQDPAPEARNFAAPALRTPPAGESYPYKYGADFTWTGIAGATGYELELQEELPSGTWQPLSTHKVSSPSFRPARIERGRYRWRVRATAGEDKGRWSKFRRLYMY